MRERGYRVHIFFLWLPGVELALSRVRGRVLEGGHDVPEALVRRRFDRSIRNFLAIYRHEADSWNLFNNSARVPVLVACKEHGETRIMDEELFSGLLRRYGP